MTDIRLRLPFDGPFKVSQKFGANPANYAKWKLAGHEGTDWNLPTGTPVLAMADGIIAKVKLVAGEISTNPYGKQVRIRHNGFETVSAHLSQVLVVFGQAVKAGDVIGLSGNTGNVWPVPTSNADSKTGAHLHVSFRRDGYDKKNGYVGYEDCLPYIQQTIAERLVVWWKSVAG